MLNALESLAPSNVLTGVATFCGIGDHPSTVNGFVVVVNVASRRVMRLTYSSNEDRLIELFSIWHIGVRRPVGSMSVGGVQV